MTILDSYKSILDSLGYTCDKEGLIGTKNPATGRSTPSTIDGKRLVLPTRDWLNNGFGEDYMAFHPLSESLASRGTSEVQQHMQRHARALITYYVHTLASNLLRVAVDPSLHADLPPDCSEYLRKLQKVDKDKNIVKVLDDVFIAATKKNRLVTLYLKAGGTYDGKKVNRLCVIRFPLLEILDSDSDDVCGVKVSAKHRKIISDLLRLIVPFGDSPEEYSAGTNTRVAPYLHAFLLAYHKIATQLNRCVRRYGKPMQLPLTEIPLYSEKMVAKLSDFHGDIAPLRGNQGDTRNVNEDGSLEPKSEVKTEQSTVQATTTKPAEAKPAVQVVNSRQPETAPKSTGNMKDVLNSVRPQQPQQMVNTGVQMVGQPSYMQYPQQNPAMPSWLVGQQQMAPQQMNPFAQAVAGVHQVAQQPIVQGYMQPTTGYMQYPQQQQPVYGGVMPPNINGLL